LKNFLVLRSLVDTHLRKLRISTRFSESNVIVLIRLFEPFF
jgi:hypothetical protein